MESLPRDSQSLSRDSESLAVLFPILFLSLFFFYRVLALGGKVKSVVRALKGLRYQCLFLLMGCMSLHA